MLKKINFIHLIGFLISFFLIIILSFWQLFVDKKYNFYFKLNNIFSKETYKKLIKKDNQKPNLNIQNKGIIYIKNNSLYYEKENQLITIDAINDFHLEDLTVSPNKDKICYILMNNDKKLLKAYSLAKKDFIFINEYPKKQYITIIGWDKNSEQIYFSIKTEDNKWKILGLSSNNITNVLVDGINFDKTNLTVSIDPIDQFIIFPNCLDVCHFSVFDLQQRTISREVKISSSETVSSDINFLYFSEKYDRIIYYANDKKEIFILDFTGYLWNSIDDLTVNKIIFKGFLTGIDKLWFLSQSENRHEVYIYDLKYIGLKIRNIEKNQEMIFQINNFDDFILIRDKDSGDVLLKNILTGEQKKIIEGINYLKVI